jgi:group I intron endonuclease
MRVYLVTNKINGKVYVGKTERSLNTRWRHHVRSARSGSPFRFHKALRKYGEQGFEVVELCRANSAEELDILERLFTHLCRSTEFALGYNSVVGGGPSEYNRQRTSAFMKAHPERWPKNTGGWKHSRQTKQNMSIARQGVGNANAKLTDRQVVAILKNPADLEIKELAKLYRVCANTIDKIRSGERRANVARL